MGGLFSRKKIVHWVEQRFFKNMTVDQMSAFAKKKKIVFISVGVGLGLLGGGVIDLAVPFPALKPIAPIILGVGGGILGWQVDKLIFNFEDVRNRAPKTGPGHEECIKYIKNPADAPDHCKWNWEGDYNADGTPRDGRSTAQRQFDDKLWVDMQQADGNPWSFNNTVPASTYKATAENIDNILKEDTSGLNTCIWARLREHVDLHSGTASDTSSIAGKLAQSRAPYAAKAFFETLDGEGSDGAWQERWMLLSQIYPTEIYYTPESNYTKKGGYFPGWTDRWPDCKENCNTGYRLYCDKMGGSGGADPWSMSKAGVFAPCNGHRNLYGRARTDKSIGPNGKPEETPWMYYSYRDKAINGASWVKSGAGDP